MRTLLLRSLFIVIVIGACGCEPRLEQRPLTLREIEPAMAAEGSSVTVELRGELIQPVVDTNFRRPDKSHVDASFVAELVRDDAATVPLVNVAFLGRGRLSATVPGSVAQGVWDVRVTDPEGQVATLAAAFRVVAPATAVSTFEWSPISTQRANVPFTGTLRAVDASGQTVEGFIGTVLIVDEASGLAPTSAGPFVFGELSTQLLLTTVTQANRLRAFDDAGREGRSVAFEVRRGLAVRLALAAPASATAGDCVKLVAAAQDSLGAPAELPAAIDVSVEAGASALRFFSDAACTVERDTASLEPASARAELYARALLAGSTTVRAQSAELPSAQTSFMVNAGPAARLAFSSDMQSIATDVCTGPFEVRVEDAFGNEADPAAVTATVSGAPVGLALYADATCANSLGGLDLAGAGRFFVRAASTGDYELRVDPPSNTALSSALQSLSVSR